MTRSVAHDREAIDALADEWDALWSLTPGAHPFLHRAWAEAWWEHFAAAGRPLLRSSPRVTVLREGGRAVALCPWLECGLPRPGGRVVRMLVGMGQEDADYGGALLGDDPERGAAAVADVVAEDVRRGAVVNLARLRDDDPLLTAVRSRPGVVVTRMQSEDHPVLDLSHDPDPARTVSRLLKKNDVRRRWRRLGEEGEVAFVGHRSVADGGLDAFLALHDARWATRDDAPSGIFVSPRGRRFLHDASARLEAAGLLRLSFVDLDGRPVAGRFGLRHDERYLGLKSGWEPALARYGPGHMAVGKVIEHGLDDGLRTFDLMRGAGDHKTAWTDDLRPVGYWMASGPGRAGALRRRLAWAMVGVRYRERHRTGGRS